MAPHRQSLLSQVVFVPLVLTVEQKRSKATADQLIVDGHQQSRVEFKGGRMLHHDLIDDIKPLREHRRALSLTVVSVSVSIPLAELVSEADPPLLNQHGKAMHGTIEGIEQQLRCRG